MSKFIVRFSLFLILLAVLFAGYTWLTLTWSYSEGDRAGYIQKLSKKGWVCKTWEGEMALVTMPGTMTEKFYFSVRDESIANELNSSIGKRVVLEYEEHIGVPISCFAETRYFVTGVKSVGEVPPL